MDKIEKALARFSEKERERVRELLLQIKTKNFAQLDFKKLKGNKDVFRIRKGDLRIILRLDNKDKIFILAIERRNDTTYRDF